ncbi:hypothetical protein GW17_00013852, partial [Ensete ventricosum]
LEKTSEVIGDWRIELVMGPPQGIFAEPPAIDGILPSVELAGLRLSTSDRMKPASGQPPDEQRGIQAGKYGGSRNPTRVERLLRDRELRKINRAFQQEEVGRGVDGGGQAKPAEHPPEDSSREVGGEPDEEIIDGSLAPITTTGEENRRSRGRPMKQRLLVVANRLPVSAVRRGEDSWYLEVSAGGLVSALLGVKDVDARWIGWAGVNVPDEVGQRALTKALAEKVLFHTYDYARHFVSACTRILGLEGTPEGVEDQGKLTRVAAFPIGIDSDRFKRALELPAVKEHVNELTHRFAGRKVGSRINSSTFIFC